MRKHGWFRPHVRGLTAISSTTLREGGGDIITSIFADGTDGFYFDFSKTDRLFQKLTGTPADDAGENIYLGLESHGWAGRTYAQQVASAANLVTNGTFDSGTGWTAEAGWSIGSGIATCSSGTTNLYQSGILTTGSFYLVTIDITAYTSGAIAVIGGAAIAGLGSKSVIIKAASANLVLNSGSFVGSIDNVSAKLIPGNHGLQATTSAQPKWQTGGLARFDGSDDNLLTTLAPASSFTLLVKPKVAISGSARVFLGCDAGAGTGRMFIAQTAAGLISGGVGLQSTTIIYGGSDVQGATGVAALTCDGSTVRLYWNGSEIYSGAQSGAPTTSIPVAVGCNNSNGTPSTFSNADIYYALGIKKRLPQAQIAAITNKWGTS